jgi:hypothetical protein
MAEGVAMADEVTPRLRVLVVLDEEIGSGELRDEIVKRAAGADVFVVAPALVSSAFRHEMGDVDGAMGPARERLERSLNALREAGVSAEGEVGDADPTMAIRDELTLRRPGDVIVVAHREGREAWAEHGLYERIEREFDRPITELLVDTEGDSARLVEVRATDGRSAGVEVDDYGLPKLGRREKAAMVIGVGGTVVLIALALISTSDHQIAGATAARVGIAGAAILANLAHVVGLLFFQSAAYRGIWERLLADVTIAATSIAVVISLLLPTIWP